MFLYFPDGFNFAKNSFDIDRLPLWGDMVVYLRSFFFFFSTSAAFDLDLARVLS